MSAALRLINASAEGKSSVLVNQIQGYCESKTLPRIFIIGPSSLLCDALEVNDSAVMVAGDETMRGIERDGQAHLAQLLLSFGQTGENDTNRFGTSGVDGEGLGG